MQYKFVQRFAGATLLVGTYAVPSVAQEVVAQQCFQLVEIGVKPTAWRQIKGYIGTLTPGDPAIRDRSLLTQLRDQIIDLENWKRMLIEIVEAHIAGESAGNAVAANLRLSQIPKTLEQIDSITERLIELARDGNMFAAEPSFKALRTNFGERANTLCRLAKQASSGTPDLSQMRTLVGQLKDELKDISVAEEALARYIKKSNK